MVASSIVLALALAGIYSLAKVVALLIALRGTKPSERAQLISALSELFPPHQVPRLPRRAPARAGADRRRLNSAAAAAKEPGDGSG